MTEETTTLVHALEAVNKHVPRIIVGLVTSGLSPVKQHAFGALLIELGELVHQHANSQTPPSSRHAPREPPAIPPEDASPYLS
jgi:hypothetical protein